MAGIVSARLQFSYPTPEAVEVVTYDCPGSHKGIMTCARWHERFGARQCPMAIRVVHEVDSSLSITAEQIENVQTYQEITAGRRQVKVVCLIARSDSVEVGVPPF